MRIIFQLIKLVIQLIVSGKAEAILEAVLPVKKSSEAPKPLPPTLTTELKNLNTYLVRASAGIEIKVIASNPEEAKELGLKAFDNNIVHDIFNYKLVEVKTIQAGHVLVQVINES